MQSNINQQVSKITINEAIQNHINLLKTYPSIIMEESKEWQEYTNNFEYVKNQLANNNISIALIPSNQIKDYIKHKSNYNVYILKKDLL